MLKQLLHRYDPAVDRAYLILIAGLVWCIVGIGLGTAAVLWLAPVPPAAAAGLGLAGLVAAALIGTLGFSRLVRQNLDRIRSKSGKACLFSFQPWRSYFVIAVMVALGALLRRSPIPKPYLAVIYLGFGGAMVLCSLQYFREFSGR